MEMHQVRYFLALSETLSFTRAAQRCGVAQSSLTRAIKALEDELGGALFHRRHSNTQLSALGEKLKPALEQACRLLQDAERDAHDFLRAARSELRLGLMRGIAPRRLTELIGAMRAQHPEVTLQFFEDTAGALQARLLARDLDAVICAPEAADARLTPQVLYREPFVAVVSRSHRLAGRGAIRLDDLGGEACLTGVPGTRDCCGGNDDCILAMAAAGLGYGVVPAHSAAHPGVAALCLAQPGLAREVALVTCADRPDSPAMCALRHRAVCLQWNEPPAHGRAVDDLATP